MTELVNQHLHHAQLRMKKQANKNRSECTFSVGDSVFVKLEPYVQSSLSRRSSQKLSFRYFGSFTIVSRIGTVAYKLLLPESSSIHPMFHVSQLKPANKRPERVSLALLDISHDLQVPMQVLLEHHVRRNDDMVQEALIVWSHLPCELTTWEDVARVRQEFPAAPAWGQAGIQGEGVLRPLLLSWRVALLRSKPKSQKQAQEREVVSAGPILVYRVLCSLEDNCNGES